MLQCCNASKHETQIGPKRPHNNDMKLWQIMMIDCAKTYLHCWQKKGLYVITEETTCIFTMWDVSFCLYRYWIKSLWRTDSCPAAELQLHSKQKLLPPPANEHYLNFELSRGQFLNVFTPENRASSLKLSQSHLISAAQCWNEATSPTNIFSQPADHLEQRCTT